MTTTTARWPRLALDRLPELTRYHDSGCDLHSACLTCPLPRCQYDEPEATKPGRTTAQQLRNDEVLAVFQRERLSTQEIARRFNVSKRTVRRILLQSQREAHV